MWEDDGPQAAYMRRELLKDSLSPIAPTVDVLGHLQKEMARVLKDPTMDTEKKTGHLQRPHDAIPNSHL